MEPPVSVPTAKSTSPAATATADPLEDPPGHSPGSPGIDGSAGPAIDAGHSVGEFMHVRLADDPAIRIEKCTHDRRMPLAPAARRRNRAHAMRVGIPSISMESFTPTRGHRRPAPSSEQI